MSRTNKFIALAGAACLVASLLPAADSYTPPVASPVNTINDTARLLAGLPPLSDPAMAELSQQSSWQQHAKYFDTAWARLEKNQLSKVHLWAKTQVPDAFASKDTAFYMFSGPDFLYADTFFPQADTYVMCGMEPTGPLPDLSKLSLQALGGELQALQESINSVMNFSFFITKSMKNDLQNHTLRGTLPVLYLFMARSGKTLIDAGYVSLDEQGVITPRQEETLRSSKAPVPGVRIRFLSEGSNTPRTLYYFSTDISDSGLKQSGFMKFCKTLAPGNSCVKSASYLMHESYFSEVRAFLLDNAKIVIQDDSGIPCSFFTPDAWQLRVFGHYPGPIPLFKDCYQKMLAEIYRTGNPEPLDFGIGYRHRAGESTLMVATRKPPGAAPEEVPHALPVSPGDEKQPLRALPVQQGVPMPQP